MSVVDGTGGYIWSMLVEERFDSDVYAEHAQALTRFATGLVGPADAQDVVSDAILRLMSSPVWDRAVNRRALLYHSSFRSSRLSPVDKATTGSRGSWIGVVGVRAA